MIRVLIADGQKTVRQMLRLFLERETDIEVVAVAVNGREALEKIASTQPDVALVDLRMPDIDGFEIVRTASQNHPNTKILIITTEDNEESVSQALQAGAKGFLLATTPAEDLINAVRSAHKGYMQLGPGMYEKFMAAGDRLAPTESGITALAPMQAEDMAAKAPSAASLARFDQPVVLRQSPVWSRWILRTIVAVTSGVVLWAIYAEIESAVPALGQLEPSGVVQEVRVPVSGVVDEVLIEEGDEVEEGDLLVRLDTTVATAQQDNLRVLIGALEEENEVLQTLLDDGSFDPGWEGDRRELFLTTREEFQSRVAAAQLQISQLQQQLAQNLVQTESTRMALSVNQEILTDIEPLFEEGGLSRIQYLRQQQEVQTNVSELARLEEQRGELEYGITQAEEQAVTVRAEAERLWQQTMRDNDRQMTELDTQLTQAIQTLDYEEVRAPIDGVVFNLQTNHPGAVVNPSEPIMELVPQENLVARVLIEDRNIGFVHAGMPVDVRIVTYNFSEFGDVDGELVYIGSSSLPPDQTRPYYAFPAEIRLDAQVLAVEDIELPLEAGMSVQANIRTRKRSVLSIFMEQFTRQVDAFRTVQ